MNKIIILLIFTIFNIASAKATMHANDTKEIINKNNESQNIKTTLINKDYKNFILNTNKYNYTIITIWAKWCSICKKQLKIFNNIYDVAKQNNIEIIGLSIDKISETDELKDFVKNYNFPMALYANSVLTIPYPNSIPTTYFLDKDYKIFKVISGRIDEDEIYEILNIKK